MRIVAGLSARDQFQPGDDHAGPPLSGQGQAQQRGQRETSPQAPQRKLGSDSRRSWLVRTASRDSRQDRSRVRPRRPRTKRRSWANAPKGRNIPHLRAMRNTPVIADGAALPSMALDSSFPAGMTRETAMWHSLIGGAQTAGGAPPPVADAAALSQSARISSRVLAVSTRSDQRSRVSASADSIRCRRQGVVRQSAGGAGRSGSALPHAACPAASLAASLATSLPLGPSPENAAQNRSWWPPRAGRVGCKAAVHCHPGRSWRIGRRSPPSACRARGRRGSTSPGPRRTRRSYGP